MVAYRTKPEFIEAIQFDGTNGKSIQDIAGVHYLDAAGIYPVPNFDYADYWWPDRQDKEIVAVLWTGTGWVGVKSGDVLYKKSDGTLDAMSQTDFLTRYEPNI